MRLRRPAVADSRAERAARYLLQAHQRRQKFGPLPEEFAPRTLEEAYAVQAAYVGLRSESNGPVCGYKVALTTEAMRRHTGLAEPVAGDLLEGTVRRSPARVRAADFVRLLVEFELAFELGEDLPAVDAPYDRRRVAQAVRAAMPAFELADDRDADYERLREHALVLVADNAWNEGVVLGAARTDWHLLDLAGLRGEAYADGKCLGAGRGGDVMGHPLEALAWLANHLARRGLGLWRSDVVITGSLVPTHTARPGETLRFDAGPLGEVALQVH